MRKVACTGLLFTGLLLVGCRTPARSGGSAAAPAPADALTDSAPRSTGSVRDFQPDLPVSRPVLAPGRAMLAGRVVDKFDRGSSKAVIQILTTQEKDKSAPLKLQTDAQGYFTIPGLDQGQTYQLTASSKDAEERLLTGSVQERAPNLCVLIRVSEDYVTPATPGVADPTPFPGEKEKKVPPPAPTPEEKPAPPKPEKKKETKPPASIDRPVVPAEEQPTGASSPFISPSTPSPGSPLPIRNPLIGNIRTTPRLSIPAPPPTLPGRDLPETPAPAPELPREEPKPPVPEVSPISGLPTLNPPWSQVVGKSVENFALTDLDGKPWELKRDRRGKVVLLDFWHSSCGPCLRGIPHLNELQARYGPLGLEIIGVACERGSLAEKAAHVRGLRRADGTPVRMDYQVLLWGERGPTQPCPLATQLGVTAYPTVKLLDERGTIVKSYVGLGDREFRDLEREIQQRLKLAGQ